MAEINVFDNTDLTGHDGVTNNKVNNWISQIDAGGTVYDIATHHSITFKDGNDGEETVWNGLTDIMVVIPSITDIVQTPIEFAGTVNASGEVTWNTDHADGPKDGYLVFVTADCTFANLVCEAGDMAIYANEKWNIVSGENQVSIVGNNGEETTTIAIGEAKNVLTVEGKTLALALDYSSINGHYDLIRPTTTASPVNFTSMEVGTTHVQLSQAEDSTVTIGTSTSVSIATKLKSGEVTVSGTGKLLTAVTEVFTAGSFPTIVTNDKDNVINIKGSLGATTNLSDFVTSVSYSSEYTDKYAKLTKVSERNDQTIDLVTNISSTTGSQAFVTGINGSDSFTVASYYNPVIGDDNDLTYIKGISGNYISELTVGGFKLDNNSVNIATGLSDPAEGRTGDLLSSVNVSVKESDQESVLSSATVSGHVLSFGTASVAKSVTVEPSYKNLETTTYSYAPTTGTIASFVVGNFAQVSAATYTFDTEYETTYTPVSTPHNIILPNLTTPLGGYNVDNLTVTIASGTYGVGLTKGELPSLSLTPTYGAVITASVDTALDYRDENINVVDDSAMQISLPGKYTLGVVDQEVYEKMEDRTNIVSVGASGEISNASATIDLSSFVTDITFKN